MWDTDTDIILQGANLAGIAERHVVRSMTVLAGHSATVNGSQRRRRF
jgi:hypothetical protein